MTDYSKIVPGEPPFTTHDDEIREPLEQEIERLEQQLAEYEGIDGRCKRGHNKKFSYHLLGKDGCVACEGEDALQQLAECQTALKLAEEGLTVAYMSGFHDGKKKGGREVLLEAAEWFEGAVAGEYTGEVAGWNLRRMAKKLE